MLIAMSFRDYTLTVSFNEDAGFKTEIKNETLCVRNGMDELIESHCIHDALSVKCYREMDP